MNGLTAEQVQAMTRQLGFWPEEQRNHIPGCLADHVLQPDGTRTPRSEWIVAAVARTFGIGIRTMLIESADSWKCDARIAAMAMLIEDGSLQSEQASQQLGVSSSSARHAKRRHTKLMRDDAAYRERVLAARHALRNLVEHACSCDMIRIRGSQQIRYEVKPV